MEDPFLLALRSHKVRRLCVNPLCAKLLSALNRQDLCFACHDRLRLTKTLAFPALRQPAPQPRAM